ncbi:MAG: hypothetical protein HC888_00955 [Candidatus Competibacteraceae bacterium]|nr:hypothetical protein [Candidatus Competibacteraceae bacterium]
MNNAPQRPPQELLLLLGRIDGKMDSVLLRLEHNDKIHDDLDKRLTSLEKWRAYILGVAAVISALVATFAAKLTTFLMGPAS